jgi:hypothetical protein
MITAVECLDKQFGPLTYWWLSFVDRTSDVACHLGVAIVTARGNISDAVLEARDYGCNPGGEVLGERLPDVPQSPPAVDLAPAH